MNINRMMAPAIGTSGINHHHPLRPVSWSLRTVTAMLGIKMAREYAKLNTLSFSLAI